MIRFVTGILLIAASLFLFVSVITELEMQKINIITSSLLLLRSPEGLDRLNREILIFNIAAYISIAAGVILFLCGIIALYRKREKRICRQTSNSEIGH